MKIRAIPLCIFLLLLAVSTLAADEPPENIPPEDENITASQLRELYGKLIQLHKGSTEYES
jgi:hypothetical protein